MCGVRTGCCSNNVSRQPLEGVSFINIKNEFTELECEYFRKMCNFTDEERRVFDLRVKGKSIVEITLAIPMAEATVNRRIKSIKKKIVKVI